MKPILIFPLSVLALVAPAQTNKPGLAPTPPPPTTPPAPVAPATPATTAPPAAPRAPALPQTPPPSRNLADLLTNTAGMSPLQRRLYMMSNQAFWGTNPAAAATATSAPAATLKPPYTASTPTSALATASPSAPSTAAVTQAVNPATGTTTVALPGSTVPSTNAPAVPSPTTAKTTPAAPAPGPPTNLPAAVPPPTTSLAATSAPAATPRTLPGVPRAPVAPPAPGRPAAPAPAATAATNPPSTGTITLQPKPTGGLAAVVNQPSEDDLIPPGLIRFQEADLNQVLDVYAEITGRTVLRPGNLTPAKITLRAQTPLTRAEGARALEAVFALNQISVVPFEDKFVKVIPVAQAHQAAGEIVDKDKIAKFGPFTTHIVQLKYTDPKEVMAALTPFAAGPQSIVAIQTSQILVLRDYAENVKRMLEVIEKVDVAVTNIYEPVVIPIKYALATDIQQVLTSLSAGGGSGLAIGGTGTTPGAGVSGGVMRGGRLGGGRGMYGTGTSGLGVPGTTGYNPPGTTPLGATSPTAAGGGLAAARSAFAERLGRIVKSATAGAGGGAGDIAVIGYAKIIADERANSLLIFADQADLHVITNIIAKLDVVLAQVLIESLIMEVTVGDDFDFGVSMKQRTPSSSGSFLGQGAFINPKAPLTDFSSFVSAGTNVGGALSEGFTYVARFGQDLDVVAKAVAGDNRAHVLQRPRILTSHAKEANIFVGKTVPYITGYYGGYGGYYGGYGGYGVPYSQYQQLQIGMELSILPFINAEGLVVMDIRQRIQDTAGSVTINGNEVPKTTDKEATAYIAVRDRDTVILGGFIDSRDERSFRGVPVLKDIPLLGWLFKSHHKQASRNELIVLIRPTVLPTPEAASAATAVERDNLPAIRSAEREYEERIRKEKERLDRLDKKKLRNGADKKG